MDNLPARQFGTLGQEQTPMADAPTVALAFALGYAVARPQSADMFGPFLAVCEELMSRTTPGDGVISSSEWSDLMGLLPPAVARNIGMLYQAQRGQRWARTGQRHGTKPTNTGNS